MRSRVASNTAGFLLSGDIHFNNVIKLRQEGNRLIDSAKGADIDVDLSEANPRDASCLSLLLRWMHYASSQNKQLHFRSIPLSLTNMGRICGIHQLLDR